MLRMLALLAALATAGLAIAGLGPVSAQYPDKPKLQRDGVDPIGGAPAELGAMIARELPQWRELAKAANIKLQ